MPQRSICSCALCELEDRMLRNLAASENGVFTDPGTPASLRKYSSPTELLLPLRSSPVDSGSDQLLSACLEIRNSRPDFIQALLTLAFIPMLHSSVRRVLLFQPTLAEEDVTQQALSLFLQFLQSEDARTRHSHFAFAISRALKRQLFAWAQREGRANAPLSCDPDLLASLVMRDSFEAHAQLRHFLHRCVTKGDLTEAELNLLIQYKLEANHLDDFECSNGQASNALRQRLKRLLSKLRRLARS